MDRFDKEILIGVIFIVLVIILILYLLVKGINHIEDIGLKSIVESIWYGENK